MVCQVDKETLGTLVGNLVLEPYISPCTRGIPKCHGASREMAVYRTYRYTRHYCDGSAGVQGQRCAVLRSTEPGALSTSHKYSAKWQRAPIKRRRNPELCVFSSNEPTTRSSIGRRMAKCS